MKTTMKISLVILLFTSACAPKINFIGNQYLPTQSVELYFDAGDIQKEYKVMGFLQNEGREFANDPEKIKEALVAEAKRRGADAILFGDGYDERVNSSDAFGFGSRSAGGSLFGSGSGWNNHVKVFKVKLIKYQ